MSDPLVLVVLLAASSANGASDPMADAMLAATRSALGPPAIVLSEAAAESTTDREAVAISERVHARAVARVVWTDSARTVARLHVHVGESSAEWVDDQIAFSTQDAPNEKARTVGFTLATMVQRIEAAAAAAAANAATAATPPLTPVAPARDTNPLPSPPTTTPTKHDLDVLASIIGALGDAATSVGGSARVRYWPTRHFGAHLAMAARFGTVDVVDARTATLMAVAGPSYRFLTTSSFELATHIDCALIHHAMTREATSTALEISRTRWLGAVTPALDFAWSFTDNVALNAVVGAEIAFGTTTVNVGGVRVADIPFARGVAELGGRIRF